MTQSKKQLFIRRVLGLLLPALALVALSLTACDKSTSPKTPKHPCEADPTLCISGDSLRIIGLDAFSNCTFCHASDGTGNSGPPLANSDYFMNNRQRVINLVLRGNFGDPPPYIDTLVVNGDTIAGGGMPSWAPQLTNREIAGILTYLRSVLNDSTVISSTCNPDSLDANNRPICTKVARDAADMEADTVAVWEVKAVRDSLIANDVL